MNIWVNRPEYNALNCKWMALLYRPGDMLECITLVAIQIFLYCFSTWKYGCWYIIFFNEIVCYSDLSCELFCQGKEKDQ